MHGTFRAPVAQAFRDCSPCGSNLDTTKSGMRASCTAVRSMKCFASKSMGKEGADDEPFP